MLHDIHALIDMAQNTHVEGMAESPVGALLAQLYEMRDRVDAAIAELLYLRADLERSAN